MNSYLKLVGKHKEEYAFVVGAGSSLHNISQNPQFNEIQNHVVISINSSIMLMPWKDSKDSGNRYWISNDSLVRYWDWWGCVKDSKCQKIVRNSWRKYKKELDGFLYFKPRPTSEGIINSKDVGLAYCSSVPSGMDLAIQMGCKKIFLLGVDHHNIGGYDHFWQYWDKKKQPRQLRPAQGTYSQQKKVFKFNNLAYKALHKFAKERGVKIYNCSASSKVKEFKIITFDDVLEIIKK